MAEAFRTNLGSLHIHFALINECLQRPHSAAILEMQPSNAQQWHARVSPWNAAILNDDVISADAYKC